MRWASFFQSRGEGKTVDRNDALGNPRHGMISHVQYQWPIMITTNRSPFSMTLERALRRAASWHRGQNRKGSAVPYIAHPVGVALILDRLGFSEDVVIAGLLHDAVEDTDATLAEIGEEFGPDVAEMVAACSEVKTDATGSARPWIDRKRDHIEVLSAASVAARAVALADKLHNLASIRFDLEAGRPVWTLFNAGREEVLWYYRTCIDRYGAGDPALAALVAGCREMLDAVEGVASSTPPLRGAPGDVSR
ncbi:MAG: guanosine polyphosphate synthetase/pyrophosphohydrolase [Planctomycetota bacterium]|nr:guanosine polyphosphate synthetase/pyrophosphohydrolase [Planctomycetota bacterium]